MFEESPKRFCAIIGNKAMKKLKNKAPTVANLVRSLKDIAQSRYQVEPMDICPLLKDFQQFFWIDLNKGIEECEYNNQSAYTSIRFTVE